MKNEKLTKMLFRIHERFNEMIECDWWFGHINNHLKCVIFVLSDTMTKGFFLLFLKLKIANRFYWKMV